MQILFAARLKELRTEKNLNQSGLAKKLDVTQRKISYWETGKIEPNLTDLCRIAECFDVTTDYLLGRKEY